MNLTVETFWKKTLKYTERLIVYLAFFYFLSWICSFVVILFAINATGNFSFLDTLITETSVTFRDIVGIAIVKFGVENIFRYNSFGGRVQHKAVPPDEETLVAMEVEAEAPGEGPADAYAEREEYR